MSSRSLRKRIIRPKDRGDGLLWCNACKVSKEGPCVFHTDSIADQPILPFAFATLPRELEIDCKTGMKQKGIFTKVAIGKPTIFGPLVGVLSNSAGTSVEHVLRMHDGSVKYYRLESDHQCNWMKLVRQAEYAETANLLAFQQNDHIYFVSIRPLQIGEELRVGYLTQYATTIEKCRKMSSLEDGDDVAMVEESDEEMGISKDGLDFGDPLYTFLPGGDDDEGSARDNSEAESVQNGVGASDIPVDVANALPLAEVSGLVDSPEISLFPRPSSTCKPEPQTKRMRVSLRDSTTVPPLVDSSFSSPSRCTRSFLEASADAGTSSVVEKEGRKLREERLLAVLNANPYQFPEASRSTKGAWKIAHDQLVAAGHPNQPNGVSNLRILVYRYLKTYLEQLQQAQTAEETVRIKQKHRLVAMIAEHKRNQPACRNGRRKKHSLIDVDVSERSRPIHGAVTTISRDERLQAVLDVNPYQFPDGPQNSAAWKAASDKLLVTGHPPDERAVRNLQCLVSRYLKMYHQELEHARTEEEIAQVKTKRPLAEIISEHRKNQPKLLSSQGRRKKRSDVAGALEDESCVVKGKVTPRNNPNGKSQWWKHRCDICAAEFRTLALFSLHGVKHGLGVDTQSLSTTCPACGVEHATLDELMLHIERHERRPSIYKKVTKFQCQTCLRYFSSQEFLDRHVRRMHTDIGSERNFECPTCHEKYITMAALKSHERTHSARKFFECPICLLGLRGAGEMQEHAESHRVDGQFFCRFCGKAFPEFVMLRRHLRMQHDNKTYTCQVCQKVFTNPYACEKHKLVHDANFAFECETCGRKFKRKTKLEDHVKRLHNPDRVYKLKDRSEKVAKAFATAEVCQFCTRQYSSRDRLLIHQREKHLERMPAELRFPVNANGGDGGSENSDSE